MTISRTIRFAGLVALSLSLLGGCTARTRDAGSAGTPISGPETAREGKPFQLVPQQSLLTIMVYRGGTLARMGHNHIVASHDLQGIVYVPEDLTRATFELHIPVAKLTVDEPELRAQAGPDFPPGVPDSARAGTRRNMLSEALLDAEHYPEIVLRSQRVDVSAPNDLLTQMQVTVRDQTHILDVPVHYEMTPAALTANGEFSIKHSDLGLTPFSAMLGAMQVQDEMKLRFQAYFVPNLVAP